MAVFFYMSTTIKHNLLRDCVILTPKCQSIYTPIVIGGMLQRLPTGRRNVNAPWYNT